MSKGRETGLTKSKFSHFLFSVQPKYEFTDSELIVIFSAEFPDLSPKCWKSWVRDMRRKYNLGRLGPKVQKKIPEYT